MFLANSQIAKCTHGTKLNALENWFWFGKDQHCWWGCAYNSCKKNIKEVLKVKVQSQIKNCLKINVCNPIFQFLVVAKIGCENVQSKSKNVKSIRNRYLYF